MTDSSNVAAKYLQIADVLERAGIREATHKVADDPLGAAQTLLKLSTTPVGIDPSLFAPGATFADVYAKATTNVARTAVLICVTVSASRSTEMIERVKHSLIKQVLEPVDAVVAQSIDAVRTACERRDLRDAEALVATRKLVAVGTAAKSSALLAGWRASGLQAFLWMRVVAMIELAKQLGVDISDETVTAISSSLAADLPQWNLPGFKEASPAPSPSGAAPQGLDMPPPRTLVEDWPAIEPAFNAQSVSENTVVAAHDWVCARLVEVLSATHTRRQWTAMFAQIVEEQESTMNPRNHSKTIRSMMHILSVYEGVGKVNGDSTQARWRSLLEVLAYERNSLESALKTVGYQGESAEQAMLRLAAER